MFDDFLSQLGHLDRGVTMKIPIPADEDGYLDRQCPSKVCSVEFKGFEADLDAKVGEANLFCPICRHEQQSSDWATKEQLGYAQKVAVARFTHAVQDALEAGARRFNQRQRPGFVTMSLSVKADRSPVLLPRAIGEVMQQRFACERCACRYAAVGAAFFCPACGHNSALSTFSHTLQAVQTTIAAIPLIYDAFGDDKDAAQNTTRLVIEECVVKLVGAFEHFTEALFEKVANAPLHKVKRGSFQRLTEASSLWREAVGKGYEDFLSAKELSELLLLFQKRHLLAHANGIVDANYLRKSGDWEYAVGQRIVIRDTHVLALLTLIQKLAAELKRFV